MMRLYLISFYLTCMAASVPAMAAEDPKPHHPAKDMQLHTELYSNWKTPKGNSCCNNADCYPTRARFNKQTGLWEAMRRKTERWIVIPKSVYDNDDPNRLESPDGQAHLCAPDFNDPKEDKVDVIRCFRPPGWEI